MYFVGRAIHEFKNTTKYLFTLVNIAYILKSTNSSVHKHAQCCPTSKFHAHEIK